jgi:molybdate transport system substrate-binding protein
MLRQVVLAVAIVVTTTAVPRAHAEETTLAAGAGFRKLIVELATAYKAQSGHDILQVYGHVGQVIVQARESTKITLVCGDRAILESAKEVRFEGMVHLGMGKLVVAFRKGLVLGQPNDLIRDDIKRIGIPDQANAIYGKAGRQFLERAKLATAIDPKLIPVATVPQVTSYVVSGEVDAGLINATDAIGARTNIGGFVEVDAALYDPVEVVCGVRTGGKPSPATAGFVDFLATDQARKIIARYGL